MIKCVHNRKLRTVCHFLWGNLFYFVLKKWKCKPIFYSYTWILQRKQIIIQSIHLSSVCLSIRTYGKLFPPLRYNGFLTNIFLFFQKWIFFRRRWIRRWCWRWSLYFQSKGSSTRFRFFGQKKIHAMDCIQGNSTITKNIHAKTTKAFFFQFSLA